MRKKSLLHVISICLCFIMMFTCFANFAYANSGSLLNRTDMEIELIADDIDINTLSEVEDFIASAGITLEESIVNELGKVVFSATCGEILSDITVNYADEEKFCITIEEGTKTDVITIFDSGIVLVDGKRISVDSTEEYNTIVMDSINYYASPPVYTKSDYYHNSGKTATHNFQLAKNVMNYSAMGLKVALNALVPGIGTAIGEVVIDAVIAAADAGTDDYLKTTGPIYYHTTKKTFMVTSSQGCQREILSFYGKDGKRVSGKTSDVYKYMQQSGA